MKHSRPTFEQLFAEDFVDESHIQAFAEALHADYLNYDTHGEASPLLGSGPPSPTTSRIRKVSALSDFAPVNVKVKRRSKREKAQVKRKDWWFVLLRWPLLCIIFAFIAVEFGLYVLIRQLVNTKEWITAWRGQKGVLRKKLRAAKTYEEWRSAALELDDFLNFNEWKRIDEDTYYDWKLVRKVQLSLHRMRENKDARGLLGILETCIRANFAGVESPRLYSETFYGTKDLIESYFSELELSLQYIRDTTDLSVDEKRKFFKRANINLGLSALCLSGGASFGYYHFGVVKAFLDAGLLPRVVTGTSAGGLVAALVCTRTEEELKVLLKPDLANKITPCGEAFSVWVKRVRITGARFDSVQWARKCAFFTRGSMTFREAYLRTGRILNISVIPADPHSPTKLLNYTTAPNTVIWTAVIASAAVPGILNPVVLMEKREDGRLIPWNWGSKFKDGSLRVDIPVQALNSYFNVTYPVVSQVNPHVHLFFFSPRGSAGKPVAHRKGKAGWRGNFLLSAAEQWLKHELTKNFKIIRDLELLPQLLGQDWSSVFLQRFDGAVTIWPRTRLWDWFRLLSDPDPPELARMMQIGQLVTWPKLHMIENRTRIEKQIFLGRRAIRKILRSSHGHTRITPQDQLPPSISRQQSSRAASPPATDHPLSVDTEAEAAFARGSKWYFKRASGTPILPAGTSQIGALGVDGQLSGAHDDQPIETPKVPSQQETKPPDRGNSASSILSLLRNRSLPRFPFPSFENTPESGASRASNAGAEQEHAWSSESSSETIDERRMSQFSLIPTFSRRDSPTVDSNSDEED
ncbi:patatin-like phospholipase domain containing protein [Amanita muscaria]